MNFDDENEEYDDGGLDDSVFAVMSTQMPAKKTAVTVKESSTKPQAQARIQSSSRNPSYAPVNELSQSLPCTTMLPPLKNRNPTEVSHCKIGAPVRRAKSFTKSNSFTFDAIDDNDLAQLAEQLESASQKQNVRPRKGRMIPWLHPSQFSRLSQVSGDGEANLDVLTSSPEMEAV